MEYQLTTGGERLAHLVSSKLLPNVNWARLGPALLRTGRSEQLLEFFEELTVSHVTCRIVATGSSLLRPRNGREHSRDLEDPTFVSDYRSYLRHYLHISSEHLDLIYRQAERALRAVSNDITPLEAKRIRKAAERQFACCYMCGIELTFSRHEPAPHSETADERASRQRRNARLYTCEHIWPQSYGGDSIDDNFLPSCSSCNTSKKMDFATWGMAGVQSLIIGLAPSEEDLTRVEGCHRFAMHYYAARRLATKKNIKLKDAFLRIGPWTTVRTKDPDDSGDFFNLETHDANSF